MAHGAWRVARGAWRMAHGAWRVARGAWRMAHGAWRVTDPGRTRDGRPGQETKKTGDSRSACAVVDLWVAWGRRTAGGAGRAVAGTRRGGAGVCATGRGLRGAAGRGRRVHGGRRAVGTRADDCGAAAVEDQSAAAGG